MGQGRGDFPAGLSYGSRTLIQPMISVASRCDGGGHIDVKPKWA